ncbi:MAG: hypothetical protein R2780_01710 [Crocinitomicaceae bacterium]
MSLDDKVLPLNKLMSAMTSQLIWYSIDDLYRLYPTIEPRGWTADDLVIWIDQDIISGKYTEGDPKSVRVEKESFEAFLEYHTNFLNRRVERVEQGLEKLKNIKPQKNS